MALFSFGYPIRRRYPYSWFKWVTLFGGICFTVFFTALNLAANGYVLKLQYTQDYNSTTGVKQWTQQFPFSILNHAKTQCQSRDMPINSQFWTNKLGLPYTLTNAWHEYNGTVVNNAALTYTNNVLEDCVITYIKISLETLDNAGTQLIAPTPDTPVPAGTGFLTWSPKATVWLLRLYHKSYSLLNIR